MGQYIHLQSESFGMYTQINLDAHVRSASITTLVKITIAITTIMITISTIIIIINVCNKTRPRI